MHGVADDFAKTSGNFCTANLFSVNKQLNVNVEGCNFSKNQRDYGVWEGYCHIFIHGRDTMVL